MDSQQSALRRSLGRIAVLGTLAVAALAATATAATAAPTAPPSTPPSTPPSVVIIQGTMTLDCATLTEAGRKYAAQHDICGLGPSGQASPNNTVTGNCGTSQIYIYNQGNANANIAWGFDSSLGPVFYRNLGVNWTNWTYSRYGHYLDANWMASSHYSKSKVFNTYSGVVSTVLEGTVENAIGTCTILSPAAATTIT